MADVHGYAAYEPGYPMPAPGYATLSGLERGPESCGSKSRGSRGSSNLSLFRSELREALRGATTDLAGDITQELRERLEPLIPPVRSPRTLGASLHRLQANHHVAALSHTLGGVRSRPMPTPAVVPRSPFFSRTAQSPYSHVANSTRAEPDQLALTALRAAVHVEPYGSSDLGGDPSDNEPPSLTSASPSDDDDPEDPDYPREKKNNKKTKSRRQCSQDAEVVATSKIVVNPTRVHQEGPIRVCRAFGALPEADWPDPSTLPTPDPAAATSTPITTPPMAEGTGFTGMPTHPAYGVNPSTTAIAEATAASESVASSSALRWYAADYHHPLTATGDYVDVPGYATLSALRRGPGSCRSRSRGSARSSNRSPTRSEINEALRGATSKLVGDLTHEIRANLEPLISDLPE